MREGVVALWIAGDERAERAAELVAELGFPVARGVTPRSLRSGAGPLQRLDRARPPDKSISHRAALLGAMSDEPVRDRATTSTPADTQLDARRASARSARSSSSAADELVVRGAGLRERAASRTGRSTSATPAR